MTFYDEQGTPYTAPDNSTVMQVIPGARITIEVEGMANDLCEVYLSQLSNGAMTGGFLLPPVTRLLSGPPHYLDSQGFASVNVRVPLNFVALGYDLTLYFQADVTDPTNGQAYSNGIRFDILSPNVNADLAVHRGTSLGMISEIGRLDDDNAEDNEVSGSGLLNGESIQVSPDFSGTLLSYSDSGTPAGYRFPTPSNSLFLNGFSYLVPGDAGIHPDFIYDSSDTTSNYPEVGSQMQIHRKDVICRNFENPSIHHIVIPQDKGNGETKILHLYHIMTGDNPPDPTYGFMILDTETNEFRRIDGSFMQQTALDNVSPWDGNVAISPDGKLLAAILKNREYPNNYARRDKLYLMKLEEGENWADEYSVVQEAIHIETKEGALQADYDPTILFAETMTWLIRSDATGTDPVEDYALYFASNYKPTNQPAHVPDTIGAVVWKWPRKVIDWGGSNVAEAWFLKNTASFMPLTGTGKDPFKLGDTHQYDKSLYAINPEVSNLNWIKSEDHTTLSFRFGGRELDTDPWDWDVYCISNVRQNTTGLKTTEDILNISGFTDSTTVKPFGRCSNGTSAVSLLPDGSKIAFCTVDDEGDNDIFFFDTDGMSIGEPGLMSGTEFDQLYGLSGDILVVDPYIVDEDNLLFFSGEKRTGLPLKTDLYHFGEDPRQYKNLTITDMFHEPDPPFRYSGDISPKGYFVSGNGRYLFFLRQKEAGSNDECDLISVDLLNSFTITSLTGDEWGGGMVDHISKEDGWSAGDLNFVYASSVDSTKIYFKAKYKSSSSKAYQLFMLDEAFPFSTIPLTAFPTSIDIIIDNICASSDGMLVGFSLSNNSWFPDTSQKVYLIDLNSYGYMRDLTPDYNFDQAPVDGSFHFIEATEDTLPQFVYAYGAGTGGAHNPVPSRVWVYPLAYVGDDLVPAVSFPLTTEGSVFVYSAKP